MKKKINLQIENIKTVSPEDTEKAKQILDRLGNDIVSCRINKGPAVVRMALLLKRGVKYVQIEKSAKKVLRDMSICPARIEAPIMGQDCVGIEFPRSDAEALKFNSIMQEGDVYAKPITGQSAKYLPVVFGKDLRGSISACDLASAPHMLVGGALGQGARQFMHSVICGLVASRTPDEVQFIMVDLRGVELTPYAKLPNLVVPVINDVRKVVFSLRWAVAEMERRLKMFAKVRVRNISDFNSRDPNVLNDIFDDATPASDLPATVPYIVIVISDLGTVMAKVGRETLPDIQRLAAKARAAGIHLILETERPDKKVLPGKLMANIPVRVAFKTATVKDSKLILDDAGAELLIGAGDALIKCKDGTVMRVQTPSIADVEIKVLLSGSKKSTAKHSMSKKDYRRAYEVVVETQKASTSHLQRKMGIGYNHAAALIDELESNGVIGAQTGVKPRKVLVDSLPDPQMADVEMNVRLSFEDLKTLRRIAKERKCDLNDLVSESVRNLCATRRCTKGVRDKQR